MHVCWFLDSMNRSFRLCSLLSVEYLLIFEDIVQSLLNTCLLWCWLFHPHRTMHQSNPGIQLRSNNRFIPAPNLWDSSYNPQARSKTQWRPLQLSSIFWYGSSYFLDDLVWNEVGLLLICQLTRKFSGYGPSVTTLSVIFSVTNYMSC